MHAEPEQEGPRLSAARKRGTIFDLEWNDLEEVTSSIGHAEISHSFTISWKQQPVVCKYEVHLWNSKQKEESVEG